MRLSLTADELALLDLALQDRMYVLQRMAGYGPLVTKQFAECCALRAKLAALNTTKPPKRKVIKGRTVYTTPTA
jgi:hypothetical protein